MLATIPVTSENHIYFVSDPKCTASLPSFCVFLQRDPAGYCPTTSLCKLLPNKGGMCSRNGWCLRQEWGQQRKAINVKFHLIHPVLLKKSLSHFCSKEIFTHYIFHVFPAAIQTFASPALHPLWLASNPNLLLSFLHRKVQLSLYPFPAHHSYAKGISASQGNTPI